MQKTFCAMCDRNPRQRDPSEISTIFLHFQCFQEVAGSLACLWSQMAYQTRWVTSEHSLKRKFWANLGLVSWHFLIFSKKDFPHHSVLDRYDSACNKNSQIICWYWYHWLISFSKRKKKIGLEEKLQLVLASGLLCLAYIVAPPEQQQNHFSSCSWLTQAPRTKILIFFRDRR